MKIRTKIVRKQKAANGNFLPGNTVGNKTNGARGGRRKGVKNKTTVLRDLLLDALLEKDGVTNRAKVISALTQCLDTKPEQVLNLAAKLIPNNIEIDVTPEYAPVILDSNFINLAEEQQNNILDEAQPAQPAIEYTDAEIIQI